MPSRVSAAPIARLTANVELRCSPPQLLALDEGGTEPGLAEGVQDGQPGPGHPDQAEIARRQERGEGEVDDHGGHLAADLLHHGPDHRRERHLAEQTLQLGVGAFTVEQPRHPLAAAVPRRAIRGAVRQQLEDRPDQRAWVSGRHQQSGLALGHVLRDSADPGGDHRLARRPWLPRRPGCRRPGPRVSEPRPALRRRRTGAGRPRGRPPPG